MAAEMSFKPEASLTDEERAETARLEQAAALRRELAGYQTHGRDDRAAEVIAALEAIGEQVDTADAKPARGAPRKRAASPEPHGTKS